MISATLRRWRALRPRVRIALAVVAVTALLAVVGLADRLRPDPWPARAVLRTPMDTWPLAFSPDGRAFLTFGQGGITTWDVATGRKRDTWAVEEGGAALKGTFSPDGRTFAAAVFHPSRTISIGLFDAATGRARATLPTGNPSVYELVFTDDGRSLRAFLGNGSALKEAVTWDAETGRESSRRPISAPTSGGITAFSPDGRTLAISANRANAVQLWDLEADRTLGGLANLQTTSGVSWGGVGFSEDGKTLAIGREDGTTELWDLSTRTIRKTLRGHSADHSASKARFSPDGRTLVSKGPHARATTALGQIEEMVGSLFRSGPRGEEGSELVVLDVESGRTLARTRGPIHPFFSPDGRTIATRERDFSVKLRDVPGPRPSGGGSGPVPGDFPSDRARVRGGGR